MISSVIVFYWSSNYPKFTKLKGEEISYVMDILALVSFLTYLFQIIILQQKKMFFVPILIPFLTIIVGVFFGFMIMVFCKINGTPKELIYLYGVTYTSINILVMILLLIKKINKQT